MKLKMSLQDHVLLSRGTFLRQHSFLIRKTRNMELYRKRILWELYRKRILWFTSINKALFFKQEKILSTDSTEVNHKFSNSS